MATLFEYYNTGDLSGATFFGALRWGAQTFTPTEAHNITSVKLKMWRLGLPGEITICIQGTDGAGHPDNVTLASGTTDGNSIPDSAPGEWREITLGEGYILLADTKYAIVMKALDGDADNRIGWRIDNLNPTYERGLYCFDADGGESWVSYETSDCMFEEWGEPVAPPGWTGSVAGVTDPASIMGIDVEGIETVKGVSST